MTEPRKATDVLLDLESKVSMLLDIIRAQDLNIKVLSNKLNDVIGRLDKQQAVQPKIVVEAVQAPVMQPPSIPAGFTQIPAGDPDRTIPVLAESKLLDTGAPQGFRRNSRPETFAGDNAYLPHPSQEMQMPIQIPKMPPGRAQPMQAPPGREPVPPPGRTEVTVPTAVTNKKGAVMPVPQQQMPAMTEEQPMPQSAQGAIPVMQRCVDKSCKSIFLADVDIVSLADGLPVFKTRTNGTGKWMASLGIGSYRVTISKRASMNKEKLEAVQDIQVDGTQSPLELPMMIIK
jgi:hypothetical protein